MNKNQKGFTIVEVLLLLILVTLIGFVGWFVWNSNEKSKDTLKNIDESSVTGSANSAIELQTLKIPELGVQFKLPGNLKDLKYEVGQDNSVNFHMADLDKLAEACEDKGLLIINAWTKLNGQYSEEQEFGTGLVKQLDKFYIIRVGGPAGRLCSSEKVIELKQKYAQSLFEAEASVELIK